MSLKISYSAPAKIILSGEHSAVHFQPALLSAFDLRFNFTLQESHKKDSKIDENVDYAAQIVKNYLNKKKIDFKDKNFIYEINSQIPIGQGFGSSAAFSVATTACFYEFFSGQKIDTQNSLDLAIVNSLAYEMEKKFHKNPSGIDNSSSCYGGLLYYRKEFEFLKNICPLDFEIPDEIVEKIYLIDSGNRHENTAQMVELVQTKIQENGAKYKKILSDIGKTTKAVTVALYENREKLFKDAMVRNQKELSKLGVVPFKTKKLFIDLKDFGFGKIMGAGGVKEGSGFTFFICERKSKSLEKYLSDRNILYFNFKPSKKGLIRFIKD